MVFIPFTLLKSYLQDINLYRESPYDFIDYVLLKLTPILFVAFSALSSLKLLFFTQISCATPLEWSSSWTDYANQVCFIEGTYIHLYKNASNDGIERINYYQWMPFFFMLLAGLSSFPAIIWSIIRSYFNIDIDFIIKTAANLDKDCKNARQAKIYMQTLFASILMLRRKKKTNNTQMLRKCLILDGNKMIVGYFFSKIICSLNSIMLLYIVQVMIQEDTLWFGIKLLINIVQDVPWEQSASFPRLTWCDISKGIQQDILLSRIQCVLPANAVYEKIVVIIWFWVVLGLIMMFYSWVQWFSFLVRVKYHYFEKQIHLCIVSTQNYALPTKQNPNMHSSLTLLDSSNDDETKLKIENFIKDYLRMDELFILKLIEINFGEIDMQTILLSLWLLRDHLQSL